MPVAIDSVISNVPTPQHRLHHIPGEPTVPMDRFALPLALEHARAVDLCPPPLGIVAGDAPVTILERRRHFLAPRDALV
jgi:hypothetical protein